MCGSGCFIQFGHLSKVAFSSIDVKATYFRDNIFLILKGKVPTTGSHILGCLKGLRGKGQA